VQSLKSINMKRILPFFSIALVMAACNSTPDLNVQNPTAGAQPQAQTYNPDTVGLSKFQQWKAQNELANVEDYQAVQYAAAAPQKKVAKAPVRKASKPAAPVRSSSASTETSNSTVSTSDGAGTISSESGNEAKQTVKKGWSKAAKGAVIGGVVGAAGGAIINKKNPVVGGVIGGVIGAGGGYALGRGMDKKDGRIDLIPQ
jgi:hypothetical protein